MKITDKIDQVLFSNEKLNTDFWNIIHRKESAVSKEEFKENLATFKKQFDSLVKVIEAGSKDDYTTFPWSIKDVTTKFIINDGLLVITEKNEFVYRDFYDKFMK